MRPSPTDVMEADGTYNAPLHGWVCFHCGEEFSILAQGSLDAAQKAAEEHFGADPRWDPLCRAAWRVAPRKLWRRLRVAEIAAASVSWLEEELDDARSAGQSAAEERDRLRNELDFAQGEIAVLKEKLANAESEMALFMVGG